MFNNYPSTLIRNGLSSSNTIHRLLQQQQQIATNSEINNEQIREKLQPLNTQRLKTLRQATKSFIVSYERKHKLQKTFLFSPLDEYYG